MQVFYRLLYKMQKFFHKRQKLLTSLQYINENKEQNFQLSQKKIKKILVNRSFMLYNYVYKYILRTKKEFFL